MRLCRPLTTLDCRVFKGNVATAGIAFGMSESRIGVQAQVRFYIRDTTVCVALATLSLQKRDERGGASRLIGTEDDSDEGSVGVKMSGVGDSERDDQDDEL